ncbi:MAG: zf-TFIIB domain-containing protein [Polyangiaceae bacterium]|nr:zf-TFIIB domain-containing protein [Polyangiaceae bacterium]
MTTGYREPHPLCPTCSGELLPHELAHDPGSVVDVCRECAGIWVDWFDGDLTGVARDVAEGPPSSKRATGATITPSCPRCRRPLHEERYRDGSATILRCSECAGAFVPRASAEAIATFSVEDGGQDVEDGGFFAKLIERIRKALGSGSSTKWT